MLPSSAAFLLASANVLSTVYAHTQIWYPEWRGNSFLPPFSQQIYPCAGLSDNSSTARTLWPLDGGSINVTLHDDAAYIFINIGLGVNTTNFNVTLFSQPLNETGAGNLCFPKLVLPPELQVEEGTQASIQFATTGPDGEGLYNCADITFSKNATVLPTDQCKNSSTVSITPFGSSDSTTGNSPSTTSGAPASTSSSAATALVSTQSATSLIMMMLTGLFAAAL